MNMQSKNIKAELESINNPKILRDIILEQMKSIEEMASAASIYATVIDRDGEKVVVANGAMVMACAVPPFKVKIGETVLLNPQTMQIGIASQRKAAGQIAKVVRPVNKTQVEVEINNTSRLINLSESVSIDSAVANSSAIVDPSQQIVLAIMPPKKPSTKAVQVNVTWDEIGGNVTAKRELHEAIAAVRGGKTFKAYGASAPKGILFYGPPGCGKTMLGKAVATEISGDGPGAFMYIKAPEILSKFVGSAEQRVREIFEEARAYKINNNKPALVFIDEADAILSKRGSGISSDMEKSIVPSFLTEMDGMEDSGAIIILATNRPDTLDAAVVREGRIDRKIYIGRPEQKEAEQIFAINLRGLPLNGKAEDLSRESAQTLFVKEKLTSNVSGAMIAAIVNRAKQNAIRRDLAANRVSGLCLKDMTMAINQTEMEY